MQTHKHTNIQTYGATITPKKWKNKHSYQIDKPNDPQTTNRHTLINGKTVGQIRRWKNKQLNQNDKKHLQTKTKTNSSIGDKTYNHVTNKHKHIHEPNTYIHNMSNN